MQLPSRRESINFKMVPKNKQGSSAIEAVIPKVSKDAQKVKKIGINDGGFHRELSGHATTAGSCRWIVRKFAKAWGHQGGDC